jgi:DNA-binding HxlR family transcriptional regulator
VSASSNRSRRSSRAHRRQGLPDQRDSFESWVAPAQSVASLLGRKWVIPILGALQARPLRRFQLSVAIKGVSLRVLTETLQRLECEGLVSRVLIRESDHSAGVGYELTPLGRSASHPVRALARWHELWAATGSSDVADSVARET